MKINNEDFSIIFCVIINNPLNLPFVRETYEVDNPPFKGGSGSYLLKY